MANRHKIGQRKMRQAEFRGLATHQAPSKANAAPSIVPPAMSLAQWTPSMMREKPLRTIITAASAQATNRQRGGASQARRQSTHADPLAFDQTSGVAGKSGSVSGELGGGGILKKK